MNYLIQKTKYFDRWQHSLKDLRAKVAVMRRIDRAAHGNLGDNKSVGEGVSELRIDVGAGYRVYYTMRGEIVIILLVGGDKSSQPTDIKKAKALAKDIKWALN